MLPVSELAGRLDRILWHPAATALAIESLCAQARQDKYRAVVVNGSRVELAAARLEDSGLKTVALVGFPLGTADGDSKRFEAETAIDHGAQEIELVLNHGRLKDGDAKSVLRELRDVAEACDERPVCVVVESGLLTRDEVVAACHLVLDSGADCLAVGTGFWPDNKVSPEDVKLVREVVGARFAVKAAGGIADQAAAQGLIAAGATRLGVGAALPLPL